MRRDDTENQVCLIFNAWKEFAFFCDASEKGFWFTGYLSLEITVHTVGLWTASSRKADYGSNIEGLNCSHHVPEKENCRIIIAVWLLPAEQLKYISECFHLHASFPKEAVSHATINVSNVSVTETTSHLDDASSPLCLLSSNNSWNIVWYKSKNALWI